MLKAASEGRTGEEERSIFPALAAVPDERLTPADPRTQGAALDVTFEGFFQAEYPRLLRAMYLCTGDRHEAEELVQDTFVGALERWDRVRTADNRPGYLYRMAVNLYRSKLRRIARGAKKLVGPPPTRIRTRRPTSAI